MKKSELIDFLNDKYPFKNCDEWDFCGIRENENVDDEISGILIALDVTNLVINEAIKKECNIIIIHHPIFYNADDQSKINNLNLSLIQRMNENKILHIALHTCFDKDECGTSYQILKRISKKIKFIDECQQNYLCFAELKKQMKFSKFIRKIFACKLSNSVRFLEPNNKKMIKTICIGAGSCSSMLEEAINKCDCFLTGDVKWHNYLDSHNANLSIVDINHDAENVFIDKIYDDIKDNLFGLKIFKAKKKNRLQIKTFIHN